MTRAAVIITTTADSEAVLTKIANALVEQRIAACCQIGGPVASIYRWEGKVQSAEEFVCTIKTMSHRVEAVTAAIKSMHSYDEPEIVITPTIGVSQSYLKWIEESVR